MKIKLEINIDTKIETSVNVVCNDANLDQNFLIEDIPELIKDLPNLCEPT